MSDTCVICGHQLLGDCYEARVSEGRKPGTPHRWRTIGVVCEGDCARRLDAMSAADQAELSRRVLKDKLQSAGLPYREINVYGSQITVEAASVSAAQKWSLLLGKFARVRGTVETIARAKKNRGTALNPTTVRVWRVYAQVG